MKNKLSKLLILTILTGILAGCGTQTVTVPEEQPPVIVETTEAPEIILDVTGTYVHSLTIGKGIMLSQIVNMSDIEDAEKEFLSAVFETALDYQLSYIYYFAPDGYLYIFADPEIKASSDAAFIDSIYNKAESIAESMEFELTEDILADIDRIIAENPIEMDNFKGTYSVNPDGHITTALFNGYFVASSDGTMSFVPGEDAAAVLKAVDKEYANIGITTQFLFLFTSDKNGEDLLPTVSGGYTLEDGVKIPAGADINMVFGSLDEKTALYGTPGETYWYGFNEDLGDVWFADDYNHEDGTAPYELSANRCYIIITFGDKLFDDGKILVGDKELSIISQESIVPSED